ncbi:MAG: hypothetical protein AAF125_00475 [Chloroflexota bacterium]
MNETQSLKQTQRTMLLRSIYVLVSPVFMFLAVLACSGQLANMQINDEPVYVCPTSTPRPTHTPVPTDTQPDVYIPPSGWVTDYEEVCTPVWNGYAYVEQCEWVEQGGHWTNPGYTVPGATSTPRPTHTPYPTPTPYVMRPPEDFYAGDAVFTGGWSSTVNARFRLDNIAVVAATPNEDGNPRRIVTWTLEVKNVGDTPYEFFPAAQVFVTRVDVGGVMEDGVWGAGEAAADEMGLPFEYAAYSLAAGETVTVELAAYIPAGTPEQFTYLLDPTQTSDPNTITWTDETNTDCVGDVLDPGNGGVLPTPQ